MSLGSRFWLSHTRARDERPYAPPSVGFILRLRWGRHAQLGYDMLEISKCAFWQDAIIKVFNAKPTRVSTIVHLSKRSIKVEG